MFTPNTPNTPNTNAQLKEKFVGYLTDIYTIENRFSNILESYGEQLAALKEFPEFRARVYQCAEMCREHTNHILPRLESYSVRPPVEKWPIEGKGTGKEMGKEKPVQFSPYISPVAGCLTTVKPETFTGFATTLYTFLHFKISTYRVLTTLAQTFGDKEVVRLAEEHVREEIEMQRWVFERLPEIELYSLQHDGIPVPQTAWEFARQLELVGSTSTFPANPANPANPAFPTTPTK